MFNEQNLGYVHYEDEIMISRKSTTVVTVSDSINVNH